MIRFTSKIFISVGLRMHELSIARSVIDSAEKICIKENLSKVKEITLDIGVLSGVSKEALMFCWPLATKDTLFSQSELIINEIPLMIECLDCKTQTNPELFVMYCDHCNSNNVTLKSGNELRIKNMEAY